MFMSAKNRLVNTTTNTKLVVLQFALIVIEYSSVAGITRLRPVGSPFGLHHSAYMRNMFKLFIHNPWGGENLLIMPIVIGSVFITIRHRYFYPVGCHCEEEHERRRGNPKS